MDKEIFNEYIETRYQSQPSYYSKASSKNQNRYKQLQWVLIILTAVLKTFQYQELWINYRATSELLKPEIYYYKFGVGPYSENGIDRETLFV